MNNLVPVFKFLKQLEKNNNRTWFEENRVIYELARAEHTAWVASLLALFSKAEPSFSTITPKDCIFRINRDIRFSKNKLPYKTNFGAYLNARGKKSETAGYYVNLQPGRSFVAAGMWMPSSPVLANVRQEIDYNFNDFKKKIQSAALKKNFPALLSNNDRLVRPPRGYTDNNPALEYLKLKSFVISGSFTDAEVLEKNFHLRLIQSFKSAKPFVDFLNSALD